MSEGFVSQRDVTVEWGDCDPAGIVFFPNFFRWFDASTAHHFAAAGLPKPEFLRRYGVVGFPMRTTRADFHVPAAHGDELSIETRIARFGRSSFDVEHRLFRDGVVSVEGFETRVLVQRTAQGGLESCPVPEEVKRLFQAA